MEYNDVVRCAQLAEIRLVHAGFGVAPEYYREPDESRRFSFDCEISGWQYDPSAGSTTAIFSWEVKAEREDSALLHLTAAYFVAYVGLAAQNPDPAREFVERVGKFATYPYFRGLVSQLSWESGANLPIMPVLR